MISLGLEVTDWRVSRVAHSRALVIIGDMKPSYDRPYVQTRRLEKPFAEVVERARELLAKEGFGVLTEIDVQATLKKKLNVDRPPFLILGACNPTLANQALNAEPAIGVLLPCNVDVFQGEDGATWVQAMRPTVVFKLIDNPAVAPIAAEVDQRLERVLKGL